MRPSRRALIAAAPALCGFARGNGRYRSVGDSTVYGPVAGYSAFMKAFNAGALQLGPGYQQGLFVNPATFPNDTLLTWSFPNNTPPGQPLWGFNHVDYGNYSALGSYPITPKQISAISTLTAAFNWSLGGAPANFDVFFDIFLWPQSTQTTKSFEVQIFLHSPAGVQSFINGATQIGTVTDRFGTQWQVAISGNDIIIAPVGYADLTSGSVDVLELLNYLVTEGTIGASLWFTGLSLGVEPYQGEGSFNLATFAVAYA